MRAGTAPLRIAGFRLWMLGSVVSSTGSWLQRTAQDWVVLTELTHHSGTAAGLTVAFQFAPLALFSAHAGVLVDRYPTRRILLATQAVMGLSAFVLSALVVTHSARLWMVFACAFALGLGTAFDTPARQAFVSELVPRESLGGAVALVSAGNNLSRMLGPAAAGLLIAAWGTGPVFALNGLSFVLLLGVLLTLRSTRLHAPGRETPTQRVRARDGFVYVRRHPHLLMIVVCTALIATLSQNNALNQAMMATTVFHRGSTGYGTLGTVLALGSLGGSLLGVRRVQPRLSLIAVGALGMGLTMIVGSLMPSYGLYAITLVPQGLFAMTYLNSCATSVQLSTDPALRGRVIAIYTAVLLGTNPIGSPLVGWIGETFGARASVVVGGAAALLAAGICAGTLARHPSIAAQFRAAVERSQAVRAGEQGAEPVLTQASAAGARAAAERPPASR